MVNKIIKDINKKNKEDYAKDKKNEIAKMSNELLNYFSGIKSNKFDDFDEDKLDILRDASNEWDSVEVNTDGATKEQDKQLDNILEKYSKKLLGL